MTRKYEGLSICPKNSPIVAALRRAFIALHVALALALASLATLGQSVSAADARAVREVIEAQLEAFKRDDAARAFSYAAPGIRATFGTPENRCRWPRVARALPDGEAVRRELAHQRLPARAAAGAGDLTRKW